MIAGDTLCLGESITPASADGNQYIMNNVADNAFTGGESDTDKQIVIKTGTQIFAYDNLIGGKILKFNEIKYYFSEVVYYFLT